MRGPVVVIGAFVACGGLLLCSRIDAFVVSNNIISSNNHHSHGQRQRHVTRTASRITSNQQVLYSSTSSSSSTAAATPRARPQQRPTSTATASNNNSGRVKTSFKAKSVQDRTQEETVALIQDIVRAMVEVGPRAAPLRTLEAWRAISSTTQDILLRRNGFANLVPPNFSTGSNSNNIDALTANLPVILRTLFERMGATYIKLGQFIASSPTIFPKEYVVEFQKCLDQTTPLPWSTIRTVIEEELGTTNLQQHYSYIDKTPLASASIAQVHAAKLASTGEDVVIKVQKPGIDTSLKADLNFIFIAARILEFIQPDWERTSLSQVASDIRTSMLEELDFELEARNTIEFRRFLQDNDLLKQATAPRVIAPLTTKRIFTMERLRGVSLMDENAINQITNNNNNNNSQQQQQQGQDIIITALNIWSMSVVNCDFFHADVHAGNLLLLQDGRVGFIDFGIVGRISEKVFNSVQELSAALVIGDSRGMARALANMGATDEDVDIDQFASDIDQLMNRMDTVQTDLTGVMMNGNAGGNSMNVQVELTTDEKEITDLLLEIVEVTENNGLKLPREFGLLVKQSLYFDRYMKILAPNVDVMNDSRVMIGGQPRDDAEGKQSINGSSGVNGDSQQTVTIDV